MNNAALVFGLIVAIGAAVPRETTAQDASAERAPGGTADVERRGQWFSAGLGYGSLGCFDCAVREGGFAGRVSFGGTPSAQVLLGGGVDWWSGPEINLVSTLVALTGQARIYASPTSRFHVVVGVGPVLARGWDTAGVGFAGIVGAGYDVPVLDWANISPYVRWIVVHEGTNLLHAGVSVTLQ